MSSVPKFSVMFMTFIMVSAVLSSSWCETKASAIVFLMFTFDTEDFLTPETNPVLGNIVEVLNKHGVKGEFYLVAEKARVLAERFPDVIEALSDHTVGYHQNGHSVHPTIAEYSNGKPWKEAVETAFEYETKRIDIYTGKLINNETGGVRLVEEIFERKLPSFRAPGYVWSAPSLYALRELGIKASSISSSFKEITGYTLNWYLGLVQIPIADLYLDRYLTEVDLDGLKDRFRELYEERQNNGGLIIFGNHPCRLVTQAFWDFNYYQGENPGNESNIELPPLYERETIEHALQTFDDFLGYVLSYPDVKVVTSEDFLDEIDGFGPRVLGSDDLSLIATNLLENWVERPPNYVELENGEFISLVESFTAFALALDQHFESGVFPKILDFSAPWISKVIGPTEIEMNSLEGTIDIFTLAKVIDEVLEYIETNLEIPSSINIGDLIVGPADLLYTMAQMVRDAAEGEDIAHNWTVRNFGELSSSSHLIEINYGWPCLPPDGLNYTMQVEIARLQSWTLKPIPLISPSAVKPGGLDQKMIFQIVAIGLLASFFVVPLIILLIKKLKRRQRLSLISYRSRTEKS